MFYPPLPSLARMWRRALYLVAAPLLGGTALAQGAPEGTVEWARYAEPTTRYPHGVLGDEIEHGALEIKYASEPAALILRLPQARVFEDVAPRLYDLDGDGQQEVIVVESHRVTGARLVVYSGTGAVAATPYIGQRFRWLAPLGAADLDGDGFAEIAYIDRPHLAKILRVWRFRGGRLEEVAQMDGLTNHRIGERDIAGGIRHCGGAPEIIVADANWERLIAVSLRADTLHPRDIGPHLGRQSFAKAMAC